MSKRSTTTKATTPKTSTKRPAGRPKKAADPEVTVTQIRAKAEKPVKAPKPALAQRAQRAQRPKKIEDVVPPQPAVPVDLGLKAAPKATPTNNDIMKAVEGIKKSFVTDVKTLQDQSNDMLNKVNTVIDIFSDIRDDLESIIKSPRKKSWFSRRRG